jgi:hypothetical protein
MEDQHLNIFCSYGRGSRKSLEHLSQLEDNITRSFVIALKYLTVGQRRKFLEKLLDVGSDVTDPGNLWFDLQTIDNKHDKRMVQRAKKKFLLLISTCEECHKGITKKSFAQREFGSVNKALLRVAAGSKKEREDLCRRVSELYKKNRKTVTPQSLQYEDFNFSPDELTAIYELLVHGSRPDGWVFNDDFAVLIESKIGHNSQSAYQLFRHLTNSNGFNLQEQSVAKGEKCLDYELVTKTWSDIVQIFDKVVGAGSDGKKQDPAPAKSVCSQFVYSQFKEYLIMSGEILDLSFLTDPNRGYDEKTMRAQLPLFLDKMDTQVAKDEKWLDRGRRPLNNLWDYYGPKPKVNDKVRMDPHYSIYFLDPTYCAIALTISKDRQKDMKSLVASDQFDKLIQGWLASDDKVFLDRCYLQMQTWRFVDYKRGQQIGESFSTFSFRVTLSELKRSGKWHNFKNSLDSLVPLTKQLDLGFEIRYFSNKKGDLRNANSEMLKDPSKLIEGFIKFIKETKHLFPDEGQTQ